MNKISFPHIGSYHVIFKYLIKKLTKEEVLVPPKITKKTIELGSKFSPDFVCAPFKYNLGNYIEALEQGANIILQAGGGCRYGYYGELQEKILKDLGYKFEFVNFMENNHVSLKKIYKFSKKLNKKLNIFKYIYYLINTLLMILIIDKYENYMRQNMGFEIEKNSFKKTHKNLLCELSEKISILKLIKIQIKYNKLFKNIKINKPENCIKIGLVGELYSLMEPYSSCFIEEKLIEKQIEVYRKTNLTYLLITKKFELRKSLKSARRYLKYHLGADGTESVSLIYRLSQENYDGIVHIKSFGCTPEINAMSIMNKVSEENNIPVIYFSFDSQNSDVAISTRIEAFYDMLNNKKDNY